MIVVHPIPAHPQVEITHVLTFFLQHTWLKYR